MNQAGLALTAGRYRNQPVTGNNGETPRACSSNCGPCESSVSGYKLLRQKTEMLETGAGLIDVAGKMASRLQESMEQHLSKGWVDGNEAATTSLPRHRIHDGY